MGGGAAGLAYWALTYPWDTIKTRIQSGINLQPTQHALTSIYRGFHMAAMRGVLVNGISFGLYEQVKGTSELIMMMAV